MSTGHYEFEVAGLLGPFMCSRLADLQVELLPATTRLLLNQADDADLVCVLASLERNGHKVERIIVEA